VDALVWNRPLCESFYEPGALLRDEADAAAFVALLEGLRVVRFALPPPPDPTLLDRPDYFRAATALAAQREATAAVVALPQSIVELKQAVAEIKGGGGKGGVAHDRLVEGVVAVLTGAAWPAICARAGGGEVPGANSASQEENIATWAKATLNAGGTALLAEHIAAVAASAELAEMAKQALAEIAEVKFAFPTPVADIPRSDEVAVQQQQQRSVQVPSQSVGASSSSSVTVSVSVSKSLSKKPRVRRKVVTVDEFDEDGHIVRSPAQLPDPAPLPPSPKK
jgi:hypothetical protein